MWRSTYISGGGSGGGGDGDNIVLGCEMIVQQALGMTTCKNEALAVEGSAVMSILYIYMSVSN